MQVINSMSSFRIIIVYFLFHIICINNAFALRPFVTTDADVAEKGLCQISPQKQECFFLQKKVAKELIMRV